MGWRALGGRRVCVCRVGDGLVCAGWEKGRHVYGRRWVGLCWVGDVWVCVW